VDSGHQHLARQQKKSPKVDPAVAARESKDQATARERRL